MSRVTDQYTHAQQFLAGGVSASTRLNRAVKHPMLFDRAAGCRVWDLDGKEYIDLCCSHGAALIGHGDPRVMAAVQAAIARGAACGYENELHTELAQLLCESIPACERVRFTCSGTEATMHLIRLARSFTGRSKLIKIEGHFHGYHDQVMYSIGTPADQLGDPAAPTKFRGSTGMPPGLEDHLILVPFNRPDLLENAIRQHAHEVAAVICEPIHFNAGCILPTPEFLKAMRDLTQQNGILLVFDEILCAFRMGVGGAQEYLGVIPDLCTIGKAVGGGFPISAFGGRRDIMETLMPQGTCQHSGTYNGHVVSVAAAIAAVKAYREPGYYDHINTLGQKLFPGLNEIFKRHQIVGRVQGLGARFGVYFGVADEVRSYRDAVLHQRETMLRFIASAIDHGVYFHDYGGAACHHGFCSAMSLSDMDEALSRLDQAASAMAT